MYITKYEKTIIPQTIEGMNFADEYENKLRQQGCFISRAEDTQCIVITSQYHWSLVTESCSNGEPRAEHNFDMCEMFTEAKQDEKTVTTKQLEEMYEKYQKKLWREHEDVRGDDMIELGYAEEFLQELLLEFGCWDREEKE